MDFFISKTKIWCFIILATYTCLSHFILKNIFNIFSHREIIERLVPLKEAFIAIPEIDKLEVCPMKTSVVFLKTHKTGSTSVQNTLIRKAFNQNLSIAVPNQHNVFRLTREFDSDMILNPQNKVKFDMFVHHMIFQKENIRKHVNEDTYYFSIIREPFSQYVSMYTYIPFTTYKDENGKEKSVPIDKFVFGNQSRTRFMYEGPNQQSHVFGLKYEDYRNITAILELIKEIESTFNLIMINEYFDESMILLKEDLCWDYDDIVSFTLNQRSIPKPDLSERVYRRILDLNFADELVYNHFVRVFREKIHEYGAEKMQKEVKILRERRKWWKIYCIERMVPDGNNLPKKYQMVRYHVGGYVLNKYLTDNDCEHMVKSEITLTEELKEREVYKAYANKENSGNSLG